MTTRLSVCSHLGYYFFLLPFKFHHPLILCLTLTFSRYPVRLIISNFLLAFKHSPCVCISHFSHVLLFTTNGRQPTSPSVHEILQARILEWVAMPFSRGPSQPRDQTRLPASPGLAGRFFNTSATQEAQPHHTILHLFSNLFWSFLCISEWCHLSGSHILQDRCLYFLVNYV